MTLPEAWAIAHRFKLSAVFGITLDRVIYMQKVNENGRKKLFRWFESGWRTRRAIHRQASWGVDVPTLTGGHRL
jgi:methionyl-tRNA synthetase